MRKGKSMITSSSRPVAFLRAGLLLSCLALGGCVNLGGAEPPESLLTLTPTTSAPAGAAISAARGEALALHEPVVPAELDVLRVPVRIDDASLAYLKDAVWVERPAQLFRRLLAETIRTQSERVVLAGGDPAAREACKYAAVCRSLAIMRPSQRSLCVSMRPCWTVTGWSDNNVSKQLKQGSWLTLLQSVRRSIVRPMMLPDKLLTGSSSAL